MLTAASAKLAKLESLRRRLLIFRRCIITTLTIRALQYYIVARHNLPFKTKVSTESGSDRVAANQTALIPQYR